MPAEYYYTFDDVLIIPAYSDIESRQEINTSIEFLGQSLKVPIISANMDYITGPKMLRTMHELGGLGILHRFYPWEQQKEDILALTADSIPTMFSVGIRDLKETIEHIKEVSHLQDLFGVCIDVAHGHHKKVADLISMIKGSTDEALSRLKVIAGNVANLEGIDFLYQAGADAIKVGIGAGSVCTTRTVAGVGVPQLSAILECAAFADENNIMLIADGGIRNSGDVAKSIAAGANAVMVGNLFAGTDETPGATFFINNKQFKRYRGQASFGSNGERYIKEGIDGVVPVKGPIAPILHQLEGGIKSAMSYVGARTILEFQEKAKFVEVSSHTLMENSTRVTEVILDAE
jgi:IMP dehydrogenase/GMP reductase